MRREHLSRAEGPGHGNWAPGRRSSRCTGVEKWETEARQSREDCKFEWRCGGGGAGCEKDRAGSWTEQGRRAG